MPIPIVCTSGLIWFYREAIWGTMRSGAGMKRHAMIKIAMAMLKALLCAVLMAGAGAPGIALAQSSGHAGMSTIRYELADLDPSDNYVPAVTFVPPRLYSPSSANWSYQLGVPDGWPIWHSNAISGDSPLAPVSATTSYRNPAFDPATQVDASSRLSASGLSDLSMQGSVDALHAAGTLLAEADVHSGLIDFVLAPMSTMRFFADVVAGGSAGQVAGPGLMNVGAGLGTIRLREMGPVYRETSSSFYHEVSYRYGGLPERAHTVVLEFTNANLIPVDYAVTFEARASAFTRDIPLVPEPASMAMLVAGLGVVALAARRKRPVSAPQGAPAASP